MAGRGRRAAPGADELTADALAGYLTEHPKATPAEAAAALGATERQVIDVVWAPLVRQVTDQATGSNAAVARGHSRPAAGRGFRGPAAAAVGQVIVRAEAATAFSPESTVQRLVSVLGSNALARILGVANSQPSRWRAGKEQISPENRRKLVDLDHVLERLLLEIHPDQAGDWLGSPNAHLGGATPLDVFAVHGAAPVLDAIEALAVGAYA
jgi:uncharacterized protein (DUF2384 family)